jgi:hypothetical protein
VDRPPWWLWLLGLVGVALLLYAWPFPPPPPEALVGREGWLPWVVAALVMVVLIGILLLVAQRARPS